MQNAHGYAWECRAPSHDPIIFEQEVEFQEHSHKEHGVPEAHVGTLSSAARRPVLEKILGCPFGDDFSAPQSAESHTIFSNEALHLHVAAHMKKIALLALQKLPREDDEKSEDVASDAPLEDDGVPNLRGSMYSVLDDEALDFPDETEDGTFNILEEGITSSIDKLDLEDKDDAGMAVLHRAVRDNNLSLAQSLIQQGANVCSRANDGKTALHYASLNGDNGIDIMKLLLEFSGAGETMHVKDDNGQMPIHYAAQRGHTAGIKLFADRGASINVLDNYGFSPYLWAVIAGQYDTTYLLLSLGVDVNSTGADGKSALLWAANRGHSLVVELLVKMGADVMSTAQNTQLVPLEEAAACGDLLTVQLLLDSGADPNYRDRDGWSAIHWAAEQGYLDIVRLLLGHRANVNAASSYGTAPLHCAANGGHDKIVSELLQHGADPLKSTCHGWTPLHHAAFMGNASTVSSMLEAGGITSSPAQDNHGWSVLHLAVHGRHLDTVRVLLESSIMQDSRDDNGLTAAEWLEFEPDSHFSKKIRNVAFDKSRCCKATTHLRRAVHDSNIVMTELLLEQGCDVNGTDSGRTALYYAAKKGDIAILNLVLENGADPNILPPGRGTWEEFISNDIVLQRLRQAGYTKPIPDAGIDDQIKIALTQQGKDHPYGLALPRTPAVVYEEGGQVGKSVEPRSRAAKIWKRLRGERNIDAASP
jgi:ankyrin repeat protein